jgi:MraZ protein
VEGIFEHTLDAKGRLFIPAKFREDLGDSFYVTISSERCLTAYTMEKWQEMKKKIDALSTLDQKKARTFFANAAKCDLDSQGRILLPQFLRDFAGLIKDVTVVGDNNTAEIWDKEKWNEVHKNEITPEYIEGMFKELGI